MSGFQAQEKHEAKGALHTLQTVLGDDFLQNCSTDTPFAARYPMLRWLANDAASSRRSITRFADQLRILDGKERSNS